MRKRDDSPELQPCFPSHYHVKTCLLLLGSLGPWGPDYQFIVTDRMLLWQASDISSSSFLTGWQGKAVSMRTTQARARLRKTSITFQCNASYWVCQLVKTIIDISLKLIIDGYHVQVTSHLPGGLGEHTLHMRRRDPPHTTLKHL